MTGLGSLVNVSTRLIHLGETMSVHYLGTWRNNYSYQTQCRHIVARLILALHNLVFKMVEWKISGTNLIHSVLIYIENRFRWVSFVSSMTHSLPWWVWPLVAVLMYNNVYKHTKPGSFVAPSTILHMCVGGFVSTQCALVNNVFSAVKKFYIKRDMFSKGLCKNICNISIGSVKFFFDGIEIIYSKVTGNNLKSPQPRLCKSLEKLHWPKAHT